MNRKTYRAAFDSVRFHADFQEKTVRKLLAECGQPHEKERTPVKMTCMKRTLLLAAALVAVLVVSVAAVTLLLGPKEVAHEMNDPTLAAAFTQEGAVLVNEVAESEGYRFTLAGMVSGAGLSDYSYDVDASRTYVVVSVARTDGAAIEDIDEACAMTVTPLVSGFQPHIVNAWTLGGGRSCFLQNGVAYYLFDCESIEMFADHTVYLAVYQGVNVPGTDTFAMAEDGSLSMTDQLTGPRVLFTLPLDPGKADPEKAEQFLTDTGLLPR